MTLDWQPIPLSWHDFDSSKPPVSALPATFILPQGAWSYGAATYELLATESTALVKLRLRVLEGEAVFCLISDDYGTLRSAQRVVEAEDGEIDVVLRYQAWNGPARLLVRSGGAGDGGRVEILSVMQADDAPGLAPISYEGLPTGTGWPAGPSIPLAEILSRQADALRAFEPHFAKVLVDLGVGEVFSLAQGLVLAAVVRELRPDIILDLGTGLGGSASLLAIAAPDVPVLTFDNEPQWAHRISRLLDRQLPNVEAVIADIGQFDYAPVLSQVKKVFIFWDAHGYEIAARVFSHIMPLIADKQHAIFCHDIEDTRYADDGGSYQDRRMWRGYDDYIADIQRTAKVRVGWMLSGMDQAIALNDFAARNRIELGSVQHALRTAPQDLKGVLHETFHGSGEPGGMAYFTMNGAPGRNFPQG